MAYNPKITRSLLAKEFELSVLTIDTYCKRFLLKTREFFEKDETELSTTLDAALFLKREGLL